MTLALLFVWCRRKNEHVVALFDVISFVLTQHAFGNPIGFRELVQTTTHAKMTCQTCKCKAHSKSMSLWLAEHRILMLLTQSRLSVFLAGQIVIKRLWRATFPTSRALAFGLGIGDLVKNAVDHLGGNA